MSRDDYAEERMRELNGYAVGLWNSAYEVGVPVVVRRDGGGQTRTATRSDAFLSESGEAVIFLKGISGYYLLSRVMPHHETGVTTK